MVFPGSGLMGSSAKLAVFTLPFWHIERNWPAGKLTSCARNSRKFARWGSIAVVGTGFAKEIFVAMEGILNKNVLIVDDDDRMLRALAKTLSSEGATVTTAPGAGDAIEILSRRKTNVDLVITDLRMPLVTGTALVQFIHLICPELPVIVLTAFGSPESRAECLRQGAASFLEKNLSSAQLIAEIEGVFASRKPHRQPAAVKAVTDEKVKIKIDDN
jgi:CheY-like chemotaxis protein